MGTSEQEQSNYDLSFKFLLSGDPSVGKTSLIVSFMSNVVDTVPPTIGVDLRVHHFTIGGKRVKLTIWDTAGQERYRTMTSSYYRGAHGIILVYDVTKRQTFTNISDVWVKELELFSTQPDSVKILIGNKVDKESERVVSREEGMALAKELGCLFLECSAKTRENVEKCFEELALKIMEVSKLVKDASDVKSSVLETKPEQQTTSSGGQTASGNSGSHGGNGGGGSGGGGSNGGSGGGGSSGGNTGSGGGSSGGSGGGGGGGGGGCWL